jgi:hypothetical protein
VVAGGKKSSYPKYATTTGTSEKGPGKKKQQAAAYADAAFNHIKKCQ